MDAELSERLFADYLDFFNLRYQKHVRVHGDKNVDFLVECNPEILCDVKEIRPAGSRKSIQIDAYSHLRNDVNELRKKFRSSKPQCPVLLVTMNFSGRSMTGFSVARALLGDVGAGFNEIGRDHFHHLPRGNAALTSKHNTTISGVFVYDCELEGNHGIFLNPYAAYPLSAKVFSSVRRINLTKNASEEDIKELSKINYWECD